MSLTLRSATPDDLAVVVAFNAALAWETEQKRLDPATLKRGVTAVLTDPQKGRYWIAERDGIPVGQLAVSYEWSDWRNGWYWWLQSVYVRADDRRTGVFRALYEHLTEQALADPSVIGLRLYVEQANHRAQQTYIALGMMDEGYRLMGCYPLPGRESAFA